MTSESWLYSLQSASRVAAGESITDYRERVVLERLEKEKRRQQEIAQQYSDLSTPSERIRAWEKVHALRLPSDSAHPVLKIVAAATHLTLEQVQEEQRQRLRPGKTKGERPDASY